VPAGTGHRIGIDRDGDGYFDQDELDAGSDPANPLSTPLTVVHNLISLALSPGGPVITVHSSNGVTYQVEFKAHLSDPVWTSLPGNLTGTGGPVTMTDTTFSTNASRFYQVIVVP
jgi:hypothetical protein